jgi:hypothetical protein
MSLHPVPEFTRKKDPIGVYRITSAAAVGGVSGSGGEVKKRTKIRPSFLTALLLVTHKVKEADPVAAVRKTPSTAYLVQTAGDCC